MTGYTKISQLFIPANESVSCEYNPIGGTRGTWSVDPGFYRIVFGEAATFTWNFLTTGGTQPFDAQGEVIIDIQECKFSCDVDVTIFKLPDSDSRLIEKYTCGVSRIEPLPSRFGFASVAEALPPGL